MAFETPTGDKDNSSYRHELIAEFRKSLEGRYDIPKDSEGVVVLSAPPALEFKDDRDRREKTPENISRIDFAFDIWKQLAAEKLGKPIEELSEEDLTDPSLPPFILNGETEQIEPMKEVAIALGVPEKKIRLINCGDRGIGNTKTQFVEMTKEMGDAKNLTFVSSSYHVPRVARTGDANLPKEMGFDVIGVPYDQFSYDIMRKIRGEVKRIVAYSAKGDISKEVRKP